tara:strand:- start:7526 stop:7666 length:141 start_codon:yes stop_codon:yes gene_type:complete
MLIAIDAVYIPDAILLAGQLGAPFCAKKKIEYFEGFGLFMRLTDYE